MKFVTPDSHHEPTVGIDGKLDSCGDFIVKINGRGAFWLEADTGILWIEDGMEVEGLKLDVHGHIVTELI